MLLYEDLTLEELVWLFKKSGKKLSSSRMNLGQIQYLRDIKGYDFNRGYLNGTMGTIGWEMRWLSTHLGVKPPIDEYEAKEMLRGYINCFMHNSL